MWEELGIARTTDKTEIRRAYAAKLRSIDSDRDPASFVKIREAYEAALAWSSRPKGRLRSVVDQAAVKPVVPVETATVPDPPEPAPTPKPRQKPAPQLLRPVEVDDDARAFADFEQAIAEKRTLDAQRCLDRLMARGLIGIGLEQPPMRRVAELALHDFTLSADTFAELVGKLGFSDVPPNAAGAPELRRDIGHRLTADAWLVALRAKAAKNPWGKDGEDVLIARLFVSRKRVGRLPGLKSGRLLKYIEEYRRHQRWSSEHLDRSRMAAIELKFNRAMVRRRRREKLYTVLALVVIAFLIVDFFWVLIAGSWN